MHYEAAYAPTQDDMITAYRMHNRQGQVSRNFILVISGLMVVSFAALALWAHTAVILLVGVPIGALMISMALLPEWLVRRAAKKAKKEEARVVLSEDSVEFATSTVQVRHGWDIIIRASLDDHGLLLYTSPVQYLFVPAHAFRSGFPKEELRSFLLRKIKNA